MAQSKFVTSAGFPSTHWSLVGQAGQPSSEAQRQALVELLRRYLPPMRSHLVYRKRITPDRADDLIQDFLADKILEHEIIGRYQKERGKFRSFLLTALDRFLIDRIRYDGSAKRHAKGSFSLDDDPDLAETVSGDDDDPFAADWARELLKQAIERMKHDCTVTGRADLWGVFEARMLKPLLYDEPVVDYADLVKQFKLESPVQASNLLITAKRAFIRALRATVGQYEESPEQIDAEIAEMHVALAKSKR